MKKILFITGFIILFVSFLFAGEESLQMQKDEIWDMAKLYKADNIKRKARLSTAPNAAYIGKPIYKPQKKKIKTAAAQTTNDSNDTKPVVYNFTATTAWGTYKAEVIAYPGKPYFDVTFESPQPIEGIVIRDTGRQMNIFTKNLQDVTTPDDPIRINYAFSPIYVLILKANINDEIQPQIIPLFNKITNKTN
jgi:hypothetical protein